RAAPVVQPLRGRDALPGLPAARFGEPATRDRAGAGGAAVRRLGADRESRGAPPQGGHEPGLGLPPMAPRTQPALAGPRRAVSLPRWAEEQCWQDGAGRLRGGLVCDTAVDGVVAPGDLAEELLAYVQGACREQVVERGVPPGAR